MTDSGLPSYIKSAYDDVLASLPSESSGGLFGKLAAKLKGTPTGVYDGIFDSTAQLDRSNASAAASSRLSIVSSSLLSSADDEAEQTVIVLPDFKIVQGVSETKEAAKDLVEAYLSPTIGRAGLPSPRSSLRSWPLPYRALVLICTYQNFVRRGIRADLTFNRLAQAERQAVPHRCATSDRPISPSPVPPLV